ncbi:hypothetical protein [Bacillus sp. AK128]
MSEMDKKLEMIINILGNFKEEFNVFRSETNKKLEKLDRIERTLSRIENDQPKDMTGMLKQINSKNKEHDSQIEVLNKRVFNVESKIEQLNQL